MDNVSLLHGTLSSLSEVTAEKTSKAFSLIIVENILKSLDKKFTFLTNIDFMEDSIHIPSEINSLDRKEIMKVIESIIRMVYMNLEKQAGLFFISELEKHAPPGLTSQIRESGVDLELMQIEYRQKFRNKQSVMTTNKKSNKNIEEKKYYYQDKNGTISNQPTPDEIKLMQLLHQKDVNSDEALKNLNISSNELNKMIVNLLNCEYLHYVSEDEVKLTDKALSFLKERET